LYILHRGDTTAKVCNVHNSTRIAWSMKKVWNFFTHLLTINFLTTAL
jgi:hypothetical protein